VEELKAWLKANGYLFSYHPDFDHFESLTRARGRVLCGTAKGLPGGLPMPSGMTFWIHLGSGLALIGLWSGYVYRLGDTARLHDLLAELLNPPPELDEMAPWTLPEPLLERYPLPRVEEVFVLSPNDAEELSAARKKASPPLPFTPEQFVSGLRARADSVSLSAEGLLRASLGSASIHARMNPGPEVPVLFDGQVNDTGDHLRLLKLLAGVSRSPLYHGGWGTRIHFDDEFYSVEPDGRPEQPRNFRGSEEE